MHSNQKQLLCPEVELVLLVHCQRIACGWIGSADCWQVVGIWCRLDWLLCVIN